MNISKGRAEITLEQYDTWVEMERAFKKHEIVETNHYGDTIKFYSRDAFDSKQLKQISELKHLEASIPAYESEIRRLENLLKKPIGFDILAEIKHLSFWQIIKLKLKG